MEFRLDDRIDVRYLRYKVKNICRGIFYSEHYSAGEHELVAEGIDIVYKVLEDVTGLEYGSVTDD